MWLPLLGYRRVERRRDKAGGGFKKKTRPIAFASHADSHVFAYYCHLLNEAYEKTLVSRGLSPAALAYRKHPGGKTNYHFAAEAFVDVVSRADCTALTLDVAKFFDTIPHRQLKGSWGTILGVPRLPKDHYSVFKAATRFAVVPAKAALQALGVSRRQASRLGRIPCTPREFRELIRGAGMVLANPNSYGIPQGLPISGLLANIAMLEVDTVIHAAALSQGWA